MPDYPIAFQNGYKIQTVYANKLPDGSYGDVYDFQSDVKHAHPDAEILTGYCVIDAGLGLIPNRCKPWNDTIVEALTDYQDHIIPILEAEEAIDLYITELDTVEKFQQGNTVFLSDQPIQNSCISFLYRDADNYKVYSDCVIDGLLTASQKSVILQCLDEGEYFIPEKVGLKAKTFTDLGYAYDAQSDHPWFELSVDSFEVTDRLPTAQITAEQLTNAFIRCKDRWLAITPEESLSREPQGHKPALDTVIREAERKSGKAFLGQGKAFPYRIFLRVLTSNTSSITMTVPWRLRYGNS